MVLAGGPQCSAWALQSSNLNVELSDSNPILPAELPPGWRTPSLRRRELSLGGCSDAQTPPPEFRRRAVELARLHEKPIAQIARDLGISESCLRSWLHQADIDDGRRDGTSSGDQAELAQLRRELRVAKMEVEILKRAAAFFAQENVLPK